VRPSRDVLRRFTAVWAISIAVKLAAVAVFAYLVLRFLGGIS
jgi:hypothetical protein